MAADIDVLESGGMAQVCVIIADGILAINVDIFLKTDDDSAAGIASCIIMLIPLDTMGISLKRK